MFVDMPVDFKKANRIVHEEIDQPKKMSIPPNETMKPNSKQPPQQQQQQPIHVENLEEKSQQSSKKESIKPEEDTPEMIEAATKIQAVYRGFKTRSELKQKTNEITN